MSLSGLLSVLKLLLDAQENSEDEELIEEDEDSPELVEFNQYGEIIKPRIMTRHLTGQIKTASRRRKLGFSRYGEIE